VAVVETDMCAVDAIQSLTGCTFGKAARLVARPDLYGEARVTLGRLHKKMQGEGLTEEEERVWRETREGIAKRIMESGLEDIFQIEPAVDPAPKKARIVSSLICESCGESVMETRSRRFQEQVLCIPCFETMEKRY
jgi:formylmethanofuran dehydrogenase subunit E